MHNYARNEPVYLKCRSNTGGKVAWFTSILGSTWNSSHRIPVGSSSGTNQRFNGAYKIVNRSDLAFTATEDALYICMAEDTGDCLAFYEVTVKAEPTVSSATSDTCPHWLLLSVAVLIWLFIITSAINPVDDPTIRQPGFGVHRHQPSLLNHFLADQGPCSAKLMHSGSSI